MTYRIPSTLPKLERWVRKHTLSFVTERQAAFLIQQLLKTRFKFPAKGESCFPVLQRMEALLTGNVTSNPAPTPEKRVRSGKGRNRPSAALKPLPNAALTHDPETGLVIFCDGACEPNPGAGGWGFVVYRDGVEIHSECGGDPVSTNNIMEMTGALMALQWIASCDQSQDSPRLLCDSQYVVKGCNEWRHGWKAKGWRRGGPKAKDKNSVIANLDLWKELDEALTATPIKLEWVKGHAGTLGNERADELADMGRLVVLSITDALPADDMRVAIEQQLAVPA
jgi:ribonuclease HI